MTDSPRKPRAGARGGGVGRRSTLNSTEKVYKLYTPPPPRAAAEKLLRSHGVEIAFELAQEHDLKRIKAVIAQYESRLARGDDLVPGWIVWRLRQRGEITVSPKRDPEIEWLEKRYKEGRKRR